MTNTRNAVEFIAELRGTGVALWVEQGRLRYRAPKGALTPERLDELRAYKSAVIEVLESDRPAIVPAPLDRYESFPLTDVQAAYLVGRNDAFGYGGVACHVYLEVGYDSLDPDRVRAAWNRLVQRHDMLRVVVSPDGSQRVLPEVPPLEIAVGNDPEEVREQLGHGIRPPEQWPLFDLHVTQGPERAVLHVSMDFLVADWASLWMLLAEFETLHADPDAELPPLELTFRDYVLAERGLRESPRYQRDKEYWWRRVAELPPAPDLPVLDAATAPPRFQRRFLRLDAEQWAALSGRANSRGLTPSSVVLSAYAATLERWSRSPRFTLNLTVLNRLPLHAEVERVIGDFTSVSLLEVDLGAGTTFAERAAAVGTRLYDDLDHRLCSGVEVLRELARTRGRETALMPIVFTSAIGLGGGVQGRFDGFGITQTPQVFIDCQAMDDVDGLQVNWDVRDGVFPDGLVDDLFATFEALLVALASDDAAWDAREPLTLPQWQLSERATANATDAPLPSGLLHDEVFAQATRTPDAVAVVAGGKQYSYAELAGRAAGVAAALQAAGCQPGERVAIVMDRGVEQVVAVLGALLAGGVYLPVDTVQPVRRRETIFADAGIEQVLTQSWVGAGIAVDLLGEAALPAPVDRSPDEPAYVIYTSGSTGKPKGAVLSHRAALNTVVDINRRFGVTAADRVLGVANLGFDLSVYDVFGPLAVGGTLVVPEHDRRADPSHWAELIAGAGVTVWNSVPALLQMLSTYAATEPTQLDTLRLALLSGDWIPLALPDEIIGRVPGIEVIGMGGATEAAIWSNYHHYQGLQPGWKSIPYGVPLANQRFHVVDAAGRDCPVWAAGELQIAGAGVAAGYLGDEQTTAERFVTVHGERRYRTGDLGRYLPGGELEFLGREDDQVKVRGHRIELGEIEAALQEHPAVAVAGVVVDGSGTARSLLAAVEPARAPATPVDLDRITAVVEKAANRVSAGVDAAVVRTYVENLDRAIGAEMRAALQSVDDQSQQVDEKFGWLVERWRDVLTGLEPIEAEAAWSAAAEAWAQGLGEPGFLDYLRANARALPELLTGAQDPSRCSTRKAVSKPPPRCIGATSPRST